MHPFNDVPVLLTWFWGPAIAVGLVVVRLMWGAFRAGLSKRDRRHRRRCAGVALVLWTATLVHAVPNTVDVLHGLVLWQNCKPERFSLNLSGRAEELADRHGWTVQELFPPRRLVLSTRPWGQLMQHCVVYDNEARAPITVNGWDLL